MPSWFTGSIIDEILTWFAAAIAGGLNILWNLLAATAFTSPDVTLLPPVRSLSGTSLTIVNTSYVLAFLWMAILILGRDTIQIRHGPGELIPRLVIGFVGANLAMPLCSQLIGLANALTTALTSQDITSPGSMQQMREIVTGSLAAEQDRREPAGFLLIVIGLIIAILVAMLLVQWIVRLGVFIVVVGIAPIALALHGTPQTEPAAKLWWRTILGTLGTVITQAVALHTTLTVFLSPQADLPALGLPGNTGVVMKLLVVLCLLWAILKVPSMMRRYVMKSSPSQAATIVRVMLLQPLTRGLSRAASRGTTARSPSASGRRPGAGPAAAHVERPWPTGPSRGGGSRPAPRPATRPVPAAQRPSQPAPGRLSRATRPTPAPARSPAGAGPGVVGTAYPTGRPVRPYTPDEIARGVDAYTQSLRRRATSASQRRGTTTPSRDTTTYSRGTTASSGRNRL